MKTPPLTPVRSKCLWCCLDQCKEVELCLAERCPLHPFRYGCNPKEKRHTALKAIKLKSIDCVGSPQEARKCTSEGSCTLWHFRLGTNPNYSERSRAARR